MLRARLKDQLEDPPVTAFDTIVRSIMVLVSLGAVFYALSGRGFPSAAVAPSAAPQPETARLTLTATGHHCFYWNREGPISIEDSGSRLSAWLRTVQTPRVLVTADESARLGDAMILYDEACRQGVTQVQLVGRMSQPP